MPASGSGADADSFTFRIQKKKSKAARALPPSRKARKPHRVKAALEKNCLRVSAQGDRNLVPNPRSVKRNQRKQQTRRRFRPVR